VGNQVEDIDVSEFSSRPQRNPEPYLSGVAETPNSLTVIERDRKQMAEGQRDSEEALQFAVYWSNGTAMLIFLIWR
jgi:hypothetical protein